MKILLVLCLVSQVIGLPVMPDHSFDKRVLVKKDDNGAEIPGSKKVFVTFVHGCFAFKKKRQKANRVTFTCNSCAKLNHYLPVVAWREVIDSDEENDVYNLDIDTLPAMSDHVCTSNGMEDLVTSFRRQLESEARSDPTQPFPALYLRIRSSYTQRLGYDQRMLFLSDIPSYDTIQATLYKVRRDFIPPAPNTQAELDTTLLWFNLRGEGSESIVKGDVVHIDGLRVLLFASDESLRIMCRARTILADGTFRITPFLWYQTFILSAEYRDNSFVPVAFGLLPDKTRRSYDDLFGLLREALEHPSRRLELSAEWLMSDFELNIRAAWQDMFPGIQPKGCHFHYSKVSLVYFSSKFCPLI